MNLSLIRLLRRKLRLLPNKAQFTELHDLAHCALDLLCVQHRVNKLNQESVDRVWKENRKLYAELRLLAKYLEQITLPTSFSSQAAIDLYNEQLAQTREYLKDTEVQQSKAGEIPPMHSAPFSTILHVREALDRVLKADYDAAYGATSEEPPAANQTP